MKSLAAVVKRGALKLQFIGRSDGDELCLTRLHVAECHTFFALRNCKKSKNRHFGMNTD